MRFTRENYHVPVDYFQSKSNLGGNCASQMFYFLIFIIDYITHVFVVNTVTKLQLQIM